MNWPWTRRGGVLAATILGVLLVFGVVGASASTTFEIDFEDLGNGEVVGFQYYDVGAIFGGYDCTTCSGASGEPYTDGQAVHVNSVSGREARVIVIFDGPGVEGTSLEVESVAFQVADTELDVAVTFYGPGFSPAGSCSNVFDGCSYASVAGAVATVSHPGPLTALEMFDSGGDGFILDDLLYSADTAECPPGYYGRFSCEAAGYGYYVPEAGAIEQTPCPPGTWARGFAMTECYLAPPGTYTANPGSTGFSDCPAGTFSPGGQSYCDEAPAGTYVSRSGSAQATPCAQGTFQPLTGQTECLEAEPGTFVDFEGATAAIPCQPGRFQSFSGAISCEPAPIGTYVDSAGAASATACPAGGTTLATGSTSIEDCVFDTDGDSILDIHDNCPADANADQADFDGDGLGDVCDDALDLLLVTNGLSDELDALIDGAEGKDAKQLEKAAKHLAKATDPTRWIDSSTLNPKDGPKVFDEAAKTVKELSKLICDDCDPELAAAAQGIIDTIVEGHRRLAQLAVDQATAAQIDARDLAKAQKALDKGDEKLAKGKTDNAIGEYKKAWKEIQKAISG